MTEREKKRKIERDGDTVPAPSATPALSFTGFGWPPSNPAALHWSWLVSSSPLSSLPHREREQRGRPSWLLALLLQRERERDI